MKFKFNLSPDSERIMKVGQYLAKLPAGVRWQHFYDS